VVVGAGGEGDRLVGLGSWRPAAGQIWRLVQAASSNTATTSSQHGRADRS
jgi:hypothetical protein